MRGFDPYFYGLRSRSESSEYTSNADATLGARLYTGQKAGDNQHAPRELSIPHPDVSAQSGGQMLFSCHNFPWQGHKRDGFFFTARDCGQEIPQGS